MALLGSRQGCDYSEQENISCLMLGSPAQVFGEQIKWSLLEPVCAGDRSQKLFALPWCIFQGISYPVLIFIKGKLMISLKKHSQGFLFPRSLGWASWGQGQRWSWKLRVAGVSGRRSFFLVSGNTGSDPELASIPALRRKENVSSVAWLTSNCGQGMSVL